MKIIYLISLIIISILFLCIKKSDNKLNILKWISITLICLICYNTLICYILNLFYIPITIISLSIVNILLIILMTSILIKNKTIQSYTIARIDIVFLIVFTVLFGIIVSNNFNLEEEITIKYSTEDPGVHYIAAKEFYRNSSLLNHTQKHQFYDLDIMMPISYVNIGLLFKTLDTFIPETDFYKIFISFDIFILFLSGIMLYTTLIPMARNKKVLKAIAAIISVIYTLAYPLNSLLFGFLYLGIAVIIINAIIIFMNYYKEEKINMFYCKIILALLTFGLFFSYYLFVPAVYIAMFIFFIINSYKKTKKIITKNLVRDIFLILVLQTVLGFTYHILPGIVNSQVTNSAQIIQNKGYIYGDLYVNFLLIAPFCAYYIWNMISTKKLDFTSITTITLLLFIIGLFIFGMMKKVSAYYFFKNYFVLWLLGIYTFYNGMVAMYEKSKFFVLNYITVYVVLLIGCILNVDYRIQQKDKLYDLNPSLDSLMNIYHYNLYHIQNKGKYNIYSEKQIEAIKYAKENLKGEIGVVGGTNQLIWFYAITDYTEYKKMDEFRDETPIDLNKKYDYIIYFENSNFYQNNKQKILENKNVIFQNEEAGILTNE